MLCLCCMTAVGVESLKVFVSAVFVLYDCSGSGVSEGIC